MIKKETGIVREFLLSNSCRPSLSGFDVLTNVIVISAHDPTLKCRDLFTRFVRTKEGAGMTGKSAYHAARYCIDNSLAVDRGVYQFIKRAALFLEERL